MEGINAIGEREQLEKEVVYLRSQIEAYQKRVDELEKKLQKTERVALMLSGDH